MSKIRQQRTAEQIRIILSELTLRHMRDPRLQDLTITDVTIDRELQYADIYVNALGDDAREDEVMAALKGAKGYFRRELAGRLDLRTVPQLHFHWDPTLAHAEHISQLLDSIDIPTETEESGEG
ncbi:MAG: 30S ribosome-binding factor RbfA [Chloroflexota bacterium]|nr:MAG: 30S ribosome-binding factor RbfA [Chloroflexota bacterium]